MNFKAIPSCYQEKNKNISNRSCQAVRKNSGEVFPRDPSVKFAASCIPQQFPADEEQYETVDRLNNDPRDRIRDHQTDHAPLNREDVSDP